MNQGVKGVPRTGKWKKYTLEPPEMNAFLTIP
jgi:hypothetical protein